MPSAPGYKRNYEQEAAAESAKRQKQRGFRVKARRAFEKALGREIPPGMDVDHIKPLSRGGSNTKHNLQLQISGANRSYSRNKKGGMRSPND